MARVFTDVGEFHRGKGNRGARLGPRMRIGAPARGEGRQRQSPNEIATNKLYKALEKTRMSDSDRRYYRDLLAESDQVRFMHMPTLAEVISAYRNVGYNVTPDTFSYENLLPYIDRLLPRQETGPGKRKAMSETELNILRIRLAATFLRYVTHIIELQARAQQGIDEEQAIQGIPAPVL